MLMLISQMRNHEVPMIQTPDGAIPEDEIPLPPLPAAVDKDPAALMDTRYALHMQAVELNSGFPTVKP